MTTALDDRLTRLVTRAYSRELAGFFELPSLDGFDDPEELGCAVLQGWAADGLGGYDMGELDGFLKKIAKSLKRTVITAPLKAIKATVQTVKTGSFKPMKAAIKEEVKGIKSDLKTIAPVAAVVANVIPGVGQVVSAGIAAAGGLLKAKENADKQKAAQKEAEAGAAQQAADEAALAAQAAQTAQEQQQAIIDANAAQEAALQAQQQAQQSQAQAALASTANQQLQVAIQRGLIQPGMTSQQIANAVAQSGLMSQGYNLTSPEAQDIISDTVEAYQPVVAAGAGAGFDIKTAWPWLAVAAGVYFLMRKRRHAYR